jgi:hypothetical protein
MESRVKRREAHAETEKIKHKELYPNYTAPSGFESSTSDLQISLILLRSHNWKTPSPTILQTA